MRILKLVIWDLDETILTGILEEGDETVNPAASHAMTQLNAQGVLQALATQNMPSLIPIATERFAWFEWFVHIEADLGPKARKVQQILDTLEINVLDVAFVDEDPFERASIAAQIPGITAWSIAELTTNLADACYEELTPESLRRPQMYREQKQRLQDTEAAADYTDFLRTCDIQITIRPYHPEDAARVTELLTRTHRMNLGVLPITEAIARLHQPDQGLTLVAEMKDNYGDMGRCGVIYLTPTPSGEALIESLAISCRTRARGLSLAMFAGLLRHPEARFQTYRCHYLSNGSNRPLRMLLMSAGFKPEAHTGELLVEADRVAALDLPDWVTLNYQSILQYS